MRVCEVVERPIVLGLVSDTSWDPEDCEHTCACSGIHSSVARKEQGHVVVQGREDQVFKISKLRCHLLFDVLRRLLLAE